MQAAVLPTRRPNADFGGLSYQPANGNPATFSTTPIPNPGASATIPTVPVPSILRDQARKNTDPTIHQTCVVPVAANGSKERVKDLYKPGTLAFSEQPYFAGDAETTDGHLVSTKAFHRNGQNGYDKVSNLTSLGFLMECKTVAERRAEYTVGGVVKLQKLAVPDGPAEDNDPVQWITARTSNHMLVNRGTDALNRYVCLFNNNPLLVNNVARDAVAAGNAVSGTDPQKAVVELFATEEKNATTRTTFGSSMLLSPFLVPKEYVNLENVVSFSPLRPIGAVDGEFAMGMAKVAEADKETFVRKVLCTEFVHDEEKEGTEYHRLFEGLDVSSSTFPFPGTTNRVDSNRLTSGDFDSILNSKTYDSIDNRCDDLRLRVLYESVYFGVQERKEYNPAVADERHNTCYNNKAVGLLSDYCLGPWSPKGVVVYKYSTMGSNTQEEQIMDASQHALFELAVEGVGMVTEYAYDEKRDNKQRGMQGRMSLDALNQKRRLRTSVGDDFYLLVVGTVARQEMTQALAPEFGKGPANTGRPIAHSIRFIKSTSEELSKAATPKYNPYVLSLQRMFDFELPTGNQGYAAYAKAKSVFCTSDDPTLHFEAAAAAPGSGNDITASFDLDELLKDPLGVPQALINDNLYANGGARLKYKDILELEGGYPHVILVSGELFISSTEAAGATVLAGGAVAGGVHEKLIDACRAYIAAVMYKVPMLSSKPGTTPQLANKGATLSFITFQDKSATNRYMVLKGLSTDGAAHHLFDFELDDANKVLIHTAYTKINEWNERTNDTNLRMQMAGLKDDELVLGGWKIGTVMDTAATRPMPSFANSPSLDPSTFGVTTNIDIKWVSSIDLHDKFWSPTGSR